jgi:hypothetical protein
MFFGALERTFTKKLHYGGMQVEERIARIGSNDPGSHLEIPFSHVSAIDVLCFEFMQFYKEKIGVPKTANLFD